MKVDENKAYFISFFVIFVLAIVFSPRGFKTGSEGSFTQASYSDTKNNFDYYQTNIQPIFAARCVACHSCYGAPCQLQLGSFDGVSRGANLKNAYGSDLLSERHPTRLFMDGFSTEDWRKLDFFSILGGEKNTPPILTKIIEKNMPEGHEKQIFSSEDTGQCQAEWNDYKDGRYNKTGSMPLGLPALSEDQIQRIQGWVGMGAPGKSVLSTLPVNDPKAIAIETFMNDNSDERKALVHRYIYEHLFLAHIYFSEADGRARNFYRLIRADASTLQEFATRRPVDPVQNFVYKLQKINDTIVQKTHLIYLVDEAKMKRWTELFFGTNNRSLEWKITRAKDAKVDNANPFDVYADLPERSRFQYLLDDTAYHVATFILGPVCRGQLAVNSIQDHFWIFFLDPKKDPMAGGGFTYLNKELLAPAASYGESVTLKYGENLHKFREKRGKLYRAWQGEDGKPFNFNNDLIWLGEPQIKTQSPVLTVMRHFDSASVNEGALGTVPKTIWVVDYQLFEDLYYNLVAGFDVYGSGVHQARTRIHMDATRVTAEDLFLTFIPGTPRQALRNYWHADAPGFREVQKVNTFAANSADQNAAAPDSTSSWQKLVNDIVKPNYVQNELAGISTLAISSERAKEVRELKDPTDKSGKPISQLLQGQILREDLVAEWLKRVNSNMPNRLVSIEAKEFSSLSYGETAAISSHISRKRTENVGQLPSLTYILIHDKEKTRVVSMVANIEHLNMDLMFNEDKRILSQKSYLTFYEGFVGSFPNFFIELSSEEEKTQFMKDVNDLILKTPEGNDLTTHWQWKDFFCKNYWVFRDEDRFWQVYDDLNSTYLRLDPIGAGIIDLNRYWPKKKVHPDYDFCRNSSAPQ